MQERRLLRRQKMWLPMARMDDEAEKVVGDTRLGVQGEPQLAKALALRHLRHLKKMPMVRHVMKSVRGRCRVQGQRECCNEFDGEASRVLQ